MKEDLKETIVDRNTVKDKHGPTEWKDSEGDTAYKIGL